MTDENLFKDSNCDIETVPVVDFDFIPADLVCTIIPTPDPIFSCVAPIIVPEPPTDVGINCPVFKTTSKIAVGYPAPGPGSDDNCSTALDPSATIEIKKVNVDPCDYEINLDINVPIPRPPCQVVMQGGSFNALVGYADCVPPGASIQINKVEIPGDCKTPDECQYTIDLEIGVPIPRVPCPEINLRNFRVDSGYSGCITAENRFDIIAVHRPSTGCDDPGQCAFDIDFAISVPIPEPACPTISILSFSTSSAFSGPIVDTNGNVIDDSCARENKFEVTTTQTPATCDTPPQCDFGLNLEVFVPIPRIPCPEIGVGNFSVQSGYLDCLVDPQNKLTITTKHVEPTSCQDPGRCEFELDLEIAVPIPDPPCPIITASAVQVVSGFAGNISYTDENGNTILGDTCTGGENKITVTTTRTPATCDTPAQCEFQLGLEVFVPVPRIPCPRINITSVSIGSGYDQCFPATDNVFAVTTRHVPPQSCDDPGTCEFDFELRIGVPIPTPTCPSIQIGKATLNSGRCESNFVNITVSEDHTPATCDKAPTCNFILDFEAGVAIPQPICPAININDFAVNIGFVGDNTGGDSVALDNTTQVISNCAAGTNKFTITPSQTPSNCDDPGQCNFDIELEINVPIPRIPCPAINVTKFEVTSGFPQCIQDAKNAFTVTTRHQPGLTCDDPGQCNFDLEFEVAVPIPEPNCPNIYIASSQVRSGFISSQTTSDGKSCQTGGTLTITKKETRDCDGAPRCDFGIDFDVSVFIPRIPCPNIQVKEFKVETAYEGCTLPANVFRIDTRHVPGTDCSDPGSCAFDLTLAIGVPIPKPVCPNIYIKEFEVNTKIQSTDQSCPTDPNVFTITPKLTPADCPNKPATCEFETTLKLNIPIPEIPCPQINVGSFIVKSGFNSGGCSLGENVFKITATETPGSCTTPKSCAFDVDLEIYVPVPKPKCPDIQVGSFSVTSGFSGAGCDSGTNRFTVEKVVVAEGDCNTPEECQFLLNLDVNIPIPPPKCPAIDSVSVVTVTPTNATEASGNGTLVVKSGAGCGGNADTGGCDEAPSCFYTIVLVLDLKIPKVCDPKLVVNQSEIKAGYDLPTYFIATATYTPRPECLLTLDMDVSVNIPRPPCPTIQTQVNLQSIGSTAQPFANMRVISVQVPGEQCTYTITLDIGIPKIPPCPIFLPAVVDAAWSNNTQPEAEFNIQPVLITADCTYIPTFKLRIPKPKCPIFYKGDVKAYFLPANADPYVYFDIEYVPAQDNECQYTYNLQIGIPKSDCPEFKERDVRAVYVEGIDSPNVEFYIERSATLNKCEYEYYLKLEIPKPKCPEFQPMTSGTLVWLPWTAAPDIQLTIDKVNDNPCTYLPHLQLYLPSPPPVCPEFKEKDVRFVYADGIQSPNAEFYIERTDNADKCEYEYYLKLEIPKPKDCPEFIERSVRVNYVAGMLEPAIDFYIQRTPADNKCEYEYYLKLDIPKPECPEFKERDVRAVYVDGIDSPNVEFYIERSAALDKCEYEYYLKLEIPKPKCPEFQPMTSGAVTWLPRNAAPNVTLHINKVADNPCTYLPELQLYLPLPPLECPEFVEQAVRVAYVDGITSPSGVFYIRRIDDSTKCRYEYYLKLDIPKPQCPEFRPLPSASFGWLSQNAAANITLQINKVSDNPCTYLPQLQIYLPKPPTTCPKFVEQDVRAVYVDGITEPNVEFYIRESGAVIVGPGAEQCQYDYYLKLEIPKNQCPEFQPMTAAVFAWIDRSGEAAVTLSIDKVSDRPCTYLPRLQLYLPKPPLECPEFIERDIKAAYVDGIASPHIEFYIERADDPMSCKYEYYLKLDLPKPKDCPEFLPMTTGAFSWLDSTSAPNITLNITKVSEPPCTYLPALTIQLPKPPLVCPEFIEQGVRAAYVPGIASPNVEFYIRRTGDMTACKYEYYLKLDLPKPKDCPEFLPMTGGSFGWLDENAAPNITLQINKLFEPPCTYMPNLAIQLPAPKKNKLVRGSINAGWTACGGDPTLTVNISEPNSSGQQTLDINLTIPRPPTYQGGVWSITDSNGNNIGTGGPSIVGGDCNKTIVGIIQLSTVSCPQPFTALPFEAAPDDENTPPYVEAVASIPEDQILAAVVKNLQLDRSTGRPTNPEFYAQMRKFFKQIQEESDE